MPIGGDFNTEPGIPEGTNANLLSPTGMPIHSDGGANGLLGRVSSVVDTGKSRVAGTLHDLGDRIEHTGRDLESGSMFVRPVGRALNSAGEALEHGSVYLRSNDVSVIRDDVVDGIRHRPLLSAGVAIGCGWLLGKMIGSDEEHVDESRHDPEPHHEDEDEPRDEPDQSSMMESLKGRVSDVLASGIASLAARQVRNRIARR